MIPEKQIEDEESTEHTIAEGTEDSGSSSKEPEDDMKDEDVNKEDDISEADILTVMISTISTVLAPFDKLHFNLLSVLAHQFVTKLPTFLAS